MSPAFRILAAVAAAMLIGVSPAAAQRAATPGNIAAPGDSTAPGGGDALSTLTPGVLNLRAGNVNTNDIGNVPAKPGDGFEHDRRYVISLDAPITSNRRAALENLGVELGEYLPAYSYIARLGNVEPAALAQTDFVIWVGEYRDEWKIDPDIGNRPYFTEERLAIAQAGDVVVDLTLFEFTPATDAVAAVNQVPGAVIHIVQPMGTSQIITASLPAASLPALASIRDVQFVEETPEITLRSNTNNRWIVQSNNSGVTPAYNAGIRGEGQVVGVMDGRPNPNHCSFADSGVPFGPNHRKILAYNSSTGNDSHGTHVSGTAVGDAFANANTRGVAYMAKMVFNTIPSFSDTAIYNRLQTHHNQTARLHTNSWGNDGSTAYDGLARGIDRFSRDFEESLVFLAVTNQTNLRNPENAKNLLAVAATQGSPNQHHLCSGGAGPTTDGRRKPEIMAPGCNTTSSTGGSCSTTNMTGTSMACPAVAGAGALVRQYYTDGFYPTGAAVPGDAFIPSGALIKATLLNSAVDMTGMPGYPGNIEGWGRVRIDESLHFSGQPRRLGVIDERNSSGLSTGQVASHTFAVTSSAEKLKVTMVFTDVQGTAGAGQPVVNDLDLEVIAPNGTTYRGNVFSGGVSVPGGSKDPVNNVEQVHLNNPAVGEWTVRVIGAAVNQQMQGYAVVLSGAVSLGAAAPQNNTCQQSIFVGSGSTAFNTDGATTTGPDEPAACNFAGDTQVQSDIWFSHVAGCTGTLTISLCDSSYATKLALYTGPCPTQPGTAVFCDLNSCANGRSELSIPIQQGNGVRIRVGGHQGAQGDGVLTITCTEAPNCPADLDNSGAVDVQDLLILLSAWGPNPGHPADIDNSGAVDVQDLLILLSAWGPCP